MPRVLRRYPLAEIRRATRTIHIFENASANRKPRTDQHQSVLRDTQQNFSSRCRDARQNSSHQCSKWCWWTNHRSVRSAWEYRHFHRWAAFTSKHNSTTKHGLKCCSELFESTATLSDVARHTCRHAIAALISSATHHRRAVLFDQSPTRHCSAVPAAMTDRRRGFRIGRHVSSASLPPEELRAVGAPPRWCLHGLDRRCGAGSKSLEPA